MAIKIVSDSSSNVFSLEGVNYTTVPMKVIAQKAIERQIGARGLRAIMEKVMTKIMYQIPSDLTIKKVVITPESIEGADPTIIRDPSRPRAKLMGTR